MTSVQAVKFTSPDVLVESVKRARADFVRDNPLAPLSIEAHFALLGLHSPSKQYLLRPKLPDGHIDDSRKAHVKPLSNHDNGGQTYDTLVHVSVVSQLQRTPGWRRGIGMLVDYSTGQVWSRGYVVSPNDTENAETGPDLRWQGRSLLVARSTQYDSVFPDHAEHITLEGDSDFFARTMEPFLGGQLLELPGGVIYQEYDELAAA